MKTGLLKALVALFSLFIVGMLVLGTLWLRLRRIDERPDSTQHGYRTSRVLATRYSSGVDGYIIGLEFPNDPDDCNRVEIVGFLELHGGMVLGNGCVVRGPLYVRFANVYDAETANRKLLEVLPPLSTLMLNIEHDSPYLRHLRKFYASQHVEHRIRAASPATDSLEPD